MMCLRYEGDIISAECLMRMIIIIIISIMMMSNALATSCGLKENHSPLSLMREHKESPLFHVLEIFSNKNRGDIGDWILNGLMSWHCNQNEA